MAGQAPFLWVDGRRRSAADPLRVGPEAVQAVRRAGGAGATARVGSEQVMCCPAHSPEVSLRGSGGDPPPIRRP